MDINPRPWGWVSILEKNIRISICYSQRVKKLH